MYLLRRAWAELRNEVFVLPSRSLALAWVVLVLGLPLVYDDAYVLRILTMTCLFAMFAASWDMLAGYTGQVNFGHALFFGAGAYTSGLLSQKRHLLEYGLLDAPGRGRQAVFLNLDGDAYPVGADEEWGVTETNREARFYRLTEAGRKHLTSESARWARILADPANRLHLYGKTEARPGRKMGHVTRLYPIADQWPMTVEDALRHKP